MAEHLPVPSLSQIGDISLTDCILLPLLCSLVHAMSTMGKEREELCLQTSDLESCIANSLPEGVDLFTQLNQIQSSLCDLSHMVAHLPAAQTAAPPPAQISRSHHSPAPAPPSPSTRGAPAQPPNEPTQPYAAIVAGTSEFNKES